MEFLTRAIVLASVFQTSTSLYCDGGGMDVLCNLQIYSDTCVAARINGTQTYGRGCLLKGLESVCDKTHHVLPLTKNDSDPVGMMVQDTLSMLIADDGADVNICCCKNDRCNNVNFSSQCGKISSDSHANSMSVYLVLFCTVMKLIFVH